MGFIQTIKTCRNDKESISKQAQTSTTLGQAEAENHRKKVKKGQEVIKSVNIGGIWISNRADNKESQSLMCLTYLLIFNVLLYYIYFFCVQKQYMKKARIN